MTAFDDFDPNNPTYATDVFGVWADGSFKVYPRRASAMNRLSAHRQGKLYQFVPAVSRWVVLAVKRARPEPRCTFCGGTTMDFPLEYVHTVSGWEYMPDRSQGQEDCGAYGWERSGGKISEPLRFHYVCRNCHHVIGR